MDEQSPQADSPKPQRLRINRKGMRIAFSPQPMRRILNGAALMSGDGRSAYAREGRGGLRRVAQLEDGQVVVVKKKSKAERKAEKRRRHRTMKRNTA